MLGSDRSNITMALTADEGTTDRIGYRDAEGENLGEVAWNELGFCLLS